MGFDVGGLLGGGGGGGGQSMSVQQVPILTPEQKQLQEKWTNLLLEQLGQGVPAYSGQMYAGLSPLQQSGINYYGGLAPIAQQGTNIFQNALSNFNPQAGMNYLNQGSGALNTMLADYNPAADKEYWNKAFVNPAMRNFNQNIVPQIQERYAGQNAGSSGAMNRAIANAGVDLSTNLNAQLANLMYRGRESQLGRQQTGVNQALAYSAMPAEMAKQAGQIGAMGMDTMGQVMNAGNLQQQNTQAGLNEQYQKWLQGQAYSNPWLGMTNYAFTPAFENVGTVNTESPSFMQSTGFPLLGAFMGSGMGQSMMNSLFSGMFSGGGGGGGGWLGDSAMLGGADAWMGMPF